MTRPTPETDNAMRQMACFAEHPAVECLSDLARRLERQRDEAVELLRELLRSHAYPSEKTQAIAFLERMKEGK